MWEYVEGSEADFEGAPDSVTVRIGGENISTEYWAESFCSESKMREANPGDTVGGRLGFIATKGLVTAERRKVDNLQSRVNDANLTEALIAERGTRYGEFKDGAAIMQQLKDVMKGAPKWEALKPSQKEALEMIQHKIGRILNGDPDYDDNWKDVAGYATLIVKELSK